MKGSSSSYPDPQRLLKNGEFFTTAVKPELAIGTYVPWCVEIAGAWYQVDEYDKTDPEVPRAAARLLREDLSRRGPSWLANYRHPLLLKIGDVVLRCRTHIPAAGSKAVWVFDHDGISGVGSRSSKDDTLADVERFAEAWLQSRAPTPELTDDS